MTKNELREGNDALRRCLNTFETERPQDKVLLTRGVIEGQIPVRNILKQVMEFDNFEPENDPYEEHDFGKVTVDGELVFSKARVGRFPTEEEILSLLDSR